MKDNKIINTDEIGISDSLSGNNGPVGLVIIKDKDGNILVKKHNMIVRAGKDYIFGLFKDAAFPGMFTTQVDANKDANNKKIDNTLESNGLLGINSETGKERYKDYKLKYLRFKSEMDEVSFIEDVPSGEQDKDYLEFPLSDDKINIELSIGSGDHPCIKMGTELYFETTKPDLTQLCGLELILGPTKDSSEEILKIFSKIRFDVIPVTAGSSFTLEYYIYF